MTYSLFDLYNELNYVQLQVKDDLAAEREVTEHDIVLSVNGIEVKLPTTNIVVDMLKQAVHSATALPPGKLSDAEYVQQVKDFRRELTNRAFDFENGHVNHKTPPMLFMFDGITLQSRMSQFMFDNLDDLLVREIRDTE